MAFRERERSGPKADDVFRHRRYAPHHDRGSRSFERHQQHLGGNVWFATAYKPVQAGSIDGTNTLPHDRAVEKAEKAKYIPSTSAHGADSGPLRTLFVGRLSASTTEDDLRCAFARYGAVERAAIVRNVVTGESKLYGFVEFADERACEIGYLRANRLVLDGRQILVDYERSRVMQGWVPRRLGGGFGGKKESGQLRFGARDRPFKRPLGARPGGMNQDRADLEMRPENYRDDGWRQVALPAFNRNCGQAEASERIAITRAESERRAVDLRRHETQRNSARHEVRNSRIQFEERGVRYSERSSASYERRFDYARDRSRRSPPYTRDSSIQRRKR